jgi:hypothetical protein
MAQINALVKFIMININIFLSFIGFFMFGLAMYLWCSNWGNLDPGFFIGSGIVLALFGISLFFLGCIGCMSIDYQTRKLSKLVTGRKIMLVHLAMMILFLIAEIYLLRISLSAVTEYSNITSQINADDDVSTIPYATYENFISNQFNKFFFGASSECSKTLYLWFFSWINNNCPDTISQVKCQGCYSYSLTFCKADENLCYATASQEGNQYCPYTICRDGILSYFVSRVRPFAIALVALILLQAFFVLFDTMILCFRPHDNESAQLIKAGITSLETQHSTKDDSNRV